MQIVHIANWCTWLAHTLCKGLIWNYKNCWAQPWLSFGILQALRWSWECIRYFFFDWYRILFWNLEICTISLFNFGWWYTLMKNKHQISLYLGLKNGQHFADNIFKWIFLLKKYCLSFCLSLSFCMSVWLSTVRLCLSHLFHNILFPSWYHHEIFRSDYQWRRWCLCKGSRSEIKVTELKKKKKK